MVVTDKNIRYVVAFTRPFFQVMSEPGKTGNVAEDERGRDLHEVREMLDIRVYIEKFCMLCSIYMHATATVNNIIILV